MKKIIAGITGSVVVAAAILFLLLGRGGNGEIDEEQSTLSAATKISVEADAVVLPLQNAELSSQRDGIVAEILAAENDLVQKGHVIVWLERDNEIATVTRAKTRLAATKAALAGLMAVHDKARSDDAENRAVQLASAKIALRDAQEQLKHVSGENLSIGAVVTPKGAALEAARAMLMADAESSVKKAQEALLAALGQAATDDIPATPESTANKAARDMALSASRVAVLEAKEALEEAQDVGEILRDASDALASRQRDLINSKTDLDAARLERDLNLRVAQEAFDDAEEALQDTYKGWLGVELTVEEWRLDPDSLFADWGLDLEFVFDRQNLTYTNRIAPDDPSTRWSELTVYAWLFLHPNAGSFDAVCDDKLSQASSRTCIKRDIEDTWDLFQDARDILNTEAVEGPARVAAAQNAIVKAEQALQDAEDDLERLTSERTALDVSIAQAELSAAQAELDDLVQFPDPIEVAAREAALEAAQATLDDLLDWPDPLKVALAGGELERAGLIVQRLQKDRDPADVAREKAELAEAEALVATAESDLVLAKLALDDMAIKAPFAGSVASIEVDLGEEVSTETVVVRLADNTAWRLESDDLD
ncbi:MAG: hypothetical protein IH861_15190, partial [Chloroflexi bacterium]|nr:hypothetical protein [Chloroflexota bacterium]